MATSLITSLNPDIRPSILNFKDWAFMVDGDNLPKYFNSNQSFNWRFYTPTTALTASVSSSGSMTGVFKYFYTEFNKTSGEGTLFYGHESPPSPIYTTSSLSSKKVVLTLPGTSLNAGVTHLKIYRTDADGTIFYYIRDVVIGTTSFEDNNLTGDINFPFGDLDEDSSGAITQDLQWFNQISNPKFILKTKDRIIGAGCRIKNDGTVSVTNGSKTVTGSGTLWTKALEGSVFYIDGESLGFIVSTVGSQTSITLKDNYTGTTKSGKAYEIKSDDNLVQWTAKDPLTAKPQWWAWPINYNRRITLKNSGITGASVILGQPVFFGENNHILLTESGNDFVESDNSVEMGTKSNFSIATDPEDNALIFLNSNGCIYKTNGIYTQDLGIDLTLVKDGINITEIEKSQAVFYNKNSWYMLAYPSENSDENDRILVWDKTIKQFVIWKIRANCIQMIESDEDGKTVKKPWIGTVGGFIYKLDAGNNLGATSGTLTGTATSFGVSTLTDSTANFFTTGDGLEDVYVSLFDSEGEFKEEKRISSNTSTQITVDTAWTSSPQAGWYYEVGSIRWNWKSKVFDFSIEETKIVRRFLINFKKVIKESKVRVKFYFSNDPEMPEEFDHYIDFNLSYDYLPESLKDNKYRYCQFELTGHGVNDPVTIFNASMEVSPNGR